jgi:protein-S-isoprenylcysteine O-methyltransferase Ste14
VRDGGSRLRIMLLVAVSIFVANIISIVLPAGSPLRLPGRLGWEIAGVVVMWLGLVLRVWAIAVLGKAFRTTVEVDPDQAVVDRSPYRWIRHPSYTGILLVTVGFGIAAANWISLLILVIVPLYALSRRIDVEERAMIESLGGAYERYRATTKRLVPGLW